MAHFSQNLVFFVKDNEWKKGLKNSLLNFGKNLIRQYAKNGAYCGYLTFAENHMSVKILVLEIYGKMAKLGDAVYR